RPPNSFIIYRKEQVANYPKLTTAELSRILGEKWYNEPPERKAHYAKLAKEAEQKHALQYPEYKYRPAK
ncbi:high mobility group box domain-containing protein, partial [Gamsiella multidivaricata]|uniref:high mobility group box domain-containing protein n=1 Tax=Gamsiella multidivaricata TaxID=101098 RepID=UPI00221FDEA8